MIGPRLEITQSHSMKWQREINKPILLTSCMYWNPLKKKSATSQRQRKQGNRYSVFQTIPPTNRIVECVLPKCGGNVETSFLWLWRWLSVTMWTEAVSWSQNIQWINTSDHAAAVTPCQDQVPATAIGSHATTIVYSGSKANSCCIQAVSVCND